MSRFCAVFLAMALVLGMGVPAGARKITLKDHANLSHRISGAPLGAIDFSFSLPGFYGAAGGIGAIAFSAMTWRKVPVDAVPVQQRILRAGNYARTSGVLVGAGLFSALISLASANSPKRPPPGSYIHYDFFLPEYKRKQIGYAIVTVGASAAFSALAGYLTFKLIKKAVLR